MSSCFALGSSYDTHNKSQNGTITPSNDFQSKRHYTTWCPLSLSISMSTS